MTYPAKILISYAHIDNEVLGSGQEGWITSLHRALEIRLSQLMGARPDIWRDQKLQGNDFFGDEIVDQFPNVGILLSILSPRYLTSEWCMRELSTFCQVSEKGMGLRVGNKCRVFKVIKTEIPIERHPEPVRDILGYEFFRLDPQTGRARELSQNGPAELEQLYWSRLDDLAYDIAQMLELIKKSDLVEQAQNPVAEQVSPQDKNGHKVIYLANSSYDLREERNAIKRELEENGHEILPQNPPPLLIDDLKQSVIDDMARCDLSVHIVGRHYGVVPEGSTDSITQVEADIALHRDDPNFARLIWAPSDLTLEDKRQKAFYESLYTNSDSVQGIDIMESSLEEFKAAIHKRLQPKPNPKSKPVGDDPDEIVSVYVICEEADLEAVEPLEDFLYDQGYEVILPVFDGDEAQIREDHLENLRTCSAFLIYFGNSDELWLRAKLRELQKIAGYGRTSSPLARAIYVGEPENRKKERLRSRDVLVVKAMNGFEADQLDDFIQKLGQGQRS